MRDIQSEQDGDDPFAFRDCADLSGAGARRQVVILGAGPVGLCAAIDLARHGIPSVVIDARNAASDGSRAICWAKRTLEICDRLGTADALVARGVTWHRGKVHFGETEVYDFDLQPQPDHHRPAFINLQQFHFEAAAIEQARRHSLIDLRWQHRATGLHRNSDGDITLDIDTPAGRYALTAEWLLACDGVRSTVRHALGLEFEGRVFDDHFLIADIRMRADFPAVRRFWFEPVFSDGGSALMHKQADDVWRCDFQLGRDADPGREREPARIKDRLRRMLGGAEFELVWSSVYTFTCRRLARFRHGRVFFAGDSAHVVSPFGARGGNGGIQDADNLAWKLAAVLQGTAPEALLDSYEAERIPAADENIRNSTRSTDFITPKSAASRVFRDAVLDLARNHPFARQMVNSGRLSLPANYAGSPLNTGDADHFAAGPPPGAPCPDAPATGPAGDWLLQHLGDDFTLLYNGGRGEAHELVAGLTPAVRPLAIGSDLRDTGDRIAEGYGLSCPARPARRSPMAPPGPRCCRRRTRPRPRPHGDNLT